MKHLLLALGLLTITASATPAHVECSDYTPCEDGWTCASSDYGNYCVEDPIYPDPYHVVAKRQSSFPVTSGAPGVVSRQPVDSLSGDLRSLTIIALLNLQAKPEADLLSYYQIAGIHGRPHIPWSYTSSQQSGDYGYCTHKSVLFATWHRPYLVLLEQELQKAAVAEANRAPAGAARTRWLSVAANVRLPYWDWASTPGLPRAAQGRTVSVNRPSGAGQTVRNPFAYYPFQREDYRRRWFRDDDSVFAGLAETRRYSGAGATLSSLYDGRRRSTYELFTISDFSRFSTAQFTGSDTPDNLESVEGLHDTIHGVIGASNGAHMGSIGVSAFDPIFWLHHCNVDRLAAIYQAINPGSVVQPLDGSAVMGRPRGGVETIDTPLYPFRKANGREWTSRDVSDAKSCYSSGYAYPEVPPNYQTRSNADLSAYARQQVDRLYAPSLTGANAFVGVPPANRRRAEADDDAPAPSGDPNSPVKERREWLTTIIYDESQIEGTFTVWVYVGDVPSSIDDKLTADNLVGGCTSFSSGMSSSMADQKSLISSTVPLTEALLAKGVDLNNESAVEYLTANLHWRILKSGVEVPVSELPSLQVGCSAAKVKYFEDPKKLPETGAWSTFYAITEKKEGGMKLKDGDLLKSKDVAGNGTTVAAPPAKDN